MIILALDLGRRLGWALGENPIDLRSGFEVLGKPGAPLDHMLGNLLRWLQAQFEKAEPALLVKEAPLSLAAFQRLGTGEDAVRAAYAQHGVVEATCNHWGVECRDVNVLVATKHFTGKASWGGRQERKRAIIARCHALGYLKRDETTDDNESDALAVWDWAQATIARKPPQELILF